MVTMGAVVSPVDGVAVGVGVGVGVDVAVGDGVGVGVGVDVAVGDGVGDGVGVVVENQLVLLPLFVELAGLIMVLLILLESFTSTYVIFFVPVGFTFHCVPATVLRSLIRLPDAPVSVQAPPMACVLPASKLSCLPDCVQVKLAKVFAPVMVEAIEPVNATVPLVPALNVPVFVQLPVRLRVPLLVFNVPALVISPSIVHLLSLISNVCPVTALIPDAHKGAEK